MYVTTKVIYRKGVMEAVRNTPSDEQLESAWYAVTKGEFGLDEDPALVDLIQKMCDYSAPLIDCAEQVDGEGNVIAEVSGDEMARRIAKAVATLSYGW